LRSAVDARWEPVENRWKLVADEPDRPLVAVMAPPAETVIDRGILGPSEVVEHAVALDGPRSPALLATRVPRWSRPIA